MSLTIKAENISKEYVLRHERQARYNSLRESITNKFTSVFSQEKSETNESFWALKDINFEINQGDRVGIIGRNGAGKSTLLKILSRITEPTTGKITINGRVASLLEVGTGFHPELSGRENIYLNGSILGMTRLEIRQKFDEIVAFAEIEKFLDTPVKRYSSGMYVRLAFAVAAHLEPEILIVDEVLAVGDAQFQKKCLGKMEEVSKGHGRTVLFVSHNISSVGTLCNKGILLNNGKVVIQDKISNVIKVYEGEVASMGNNIYDLSKGLFHDVITDENEFKLLNIKFLSSAQETLKQIKTFDNFTVYAEFYSPRAVENGSISFFIKTLTGTIILRLATMPDQNFPFQFRKGINKIYCNIKSLPLPSGTFVFSMGLAIPMREWLLRHDELFTFEVKENDIFNSSYPPLLENSVAIVNYDWEILA